MDDEKLASVLAAALKQGRYERDDLYLFDTKLAWQMTNEAHVRDPEREMVWHALQAHADIAPLLGTHLNCGLNAPQLSAAALGDWLLTRASRIGAPGATAELRDFIDGAHCDVEEYLAFSGLKVDAPIALTPDVELLPIAAIPESTLSISLTDPEWFYFGRDAKGHVRRKTIVASASFGTPIWHTDPHVATAALRVRRKAFPKVVQTPVDVPRSVQAMTDILLVLAAATQTAMFPVANWVSATPANPLWGPFEWSYWSHLNALRLFATSAGNEAHIIAAVKLWEAFPASLKPKIRLPLERLNRGLAAALSVDCAIEIGVALEALLLADLGPNEQISLAFRLRGAWLLGVNAIDRNELANHFKAIYSCRSSAVHSGKLSADSYSVNSTKVSAEEFMMKEGRKLAARAVLKVIELQRIPDWSGLLLGVG
jgi:Apea-like HEPN